MRALLSLTACLTLVAGAALAGPVTLKVNPEDADGQVTLGDVFDGAGAAAGIVVAQRAGPSVVLDAAQLQAQARQSGLQWANETGLRRVVVRRGAGEIVPANTSAASAQGAQSPVQTAARPRAGGANVIARNDMVQVTFISGGVRLSLTGRATRAAGVGDPVPVLNLQSGRTIDAVASGPGQAVAGPAADAARSAQFAAR